MSNFRASFVLAVVGLGLLTIAPSMPPVTLNAQGAPAQGDHTFRITRIKFDHKGPDANDGSSPTDGLNIRRDRRRDLDHLGNGVGDGEWIRGGRNEEACYLTDKAISIKVRIECDDHLRSAVLWAEQAGVDPTLPQHLKPWIDVKERKVDFKETAPGSGLWVSWDNTPGAADPEYVEFDLEYPTKSTIDISLCTWAWKVKDIDSTSPPDPPAPNPQQYDVENTGPHRFYTVLDTPFEPWYTAGPETHPWVTALDFSISTLATAGLSTKPDAAQQTTIAIWLRGIPSYDHDQSVNQSRYVPEPYPKSLRQHLEVIPGEPKSTKELKFLLTDFIAGAHRLGDCYDLAAAVQTCGNLLGLKGRFAAYPGFGYINPTLFISQVNWIGPQINNPFFDRPGISSVKLTGLDYLYEDVNPMDRLKDRTLFLSHTYVLRAGTVLDATIGEFHGSTNEADYLDMARDTSTRQEAAQAAGIDKRYFVSILKLE
ncbi:MAG: hypothetical protein ICCCNLDF_00395 [Planctomycetes bacterium]|nr:hypothetical protein [Planctomycetota bacterium]